MNKRYDYLKEQYPEYISINQFYKICHIAKRSAVYLLEHGIVSYIDTGKTTWKYKIAIDDVITYLLQREKVGSGIPCGAVSNKRKYPRAPREKKTTDYDRIVESESELFRKYLDTIFSDNADVLNSDEAAKLLGFSTATILKRIKAGQMKAIFYNRKYFIPKVYLLDYLLSGDCGQYFGENLGQQFVEGFTIWKTK